MAAASGLPGLWADRRASWGERVSAAMLAVASVIGLAGVAMALQSGATTETISLALPLTGHAAAFSLDALSAFFLVPIFLIGAIGGIYGLGYWKQSDHPMNGRRLRLFWGWLVAGMAIVVLARNSIIFLMGWEIMALAAFFLISAEDHLPEVRRSSWIYLVATHFGTLFLFAMFATLRLAVGSFDLHAIDLAGASVGRMSLIFLLAVIGFGLKAGIMPLHFWLPAAHANAPSHVSAILSGVMIKMGIYGLMRITSLMTQPPMAWGAILLALGAISGVLGIVHALAQHDFKRLLAYSSVENIGIMLIGLGMALVGRTLGRTEWIVLGMAGCLLHVWNHSLFKSLLFLCAGSVLHATDTRQIDRLGGLAKKMPWTAALFLTGAIAICGLPPLNGFISEICIYAGMFRGIESAENPASLGIAFLAPILALIGALAVACFVKFYGAVFLGEPRTAATGQAHEASAGMIGPMVLLAVGCAFIGLAPGVVAPVLDRAVAAWSGAAPQAQSITIASLLPLGKFGMMAIALSVTAVIIWILLKGRLRIEMAVRQGTWDCGYARPTARMQYTGSSLSEMLVGLFRWVLRPQVRRPDTSPLFPERLHYRSGVEDFALDRAILPLSATAEGWLARLRSLQQGLTQHYLLYILLAVVALMIWTMPVGKLIARMAAR